MGAQIALAGRRSVGLIYFLHIPRTMGTVLKDQCLYPNFRLEQVVLDLTWHGINYANASRFRSVELACGHLGYNIKPVLRRQPQYITILRNPLYRAKSMYKFCQRVTWHYLHEAANRMSLAEFATDPETRHLVSNAMARQITNDTDVRDLIQKVGGDRAKLDRAFFSCEPVDNLLDEAKSRLSSFLFVGIADRFFESVHVMWHKLGILRPKLGPDMAKQMNPFLKSNAYPILTNEYQALIWANGVDIALYEWANDRLSDKLEEIYDKRRFGLWK